MRNNIWAAFGGRKVVVQVLAFVALNVLFSLTRGFGMQGSRSSIASMFTFTLLILFALAYLGIASWLYEGAPFWIGYVVALATVVSHYNAATVFPLLSRVGLYPFIFFVALCAADIVRRHKRHAARRPRQHFVVASRADDLVVYRAARSGPSSWLVSG